MVKPFRNRKQYFMQLLHERKGIIVVQGKITKQMQTKGPCRSSVKHTDEYIGMCDSERI